jgi:mannose-6-phosphate isomerase-like protein (cupin superfamily)
MRARVIHPRSEQEYWFREGCHILELVNHPEDPSVSIARARVEVGGCTEWHSLVDVVERYLVVQGNGTVEVDGLNPSAVGPGDVVCIPPQTAQRISNTGDVDLIFYAICSPRFVARCYRSLDN